MTTLQREAREKPGTIICRAMCVHCGASFDPVIRLAEGETPDTAYCFHDHSAYLTGKIFFPYVLEKGEDFSLYMF